MIPVKIELDILSLHIVNNPVYRLYLDNNFVVERMYTCQDEHYMREVVEGTVEGTGAHIFRIETPGNNVLDVFEIRNCEANGTKCSVDSIGQCSFIVS